MKTAVSPLVASRVQVDPGGLERFCRDNDIRRLALFGSVLGNRFRDDSDVDILVEFAPGARVGFLQLARLQDELSGLFGRRVDLRTPAELSRYFREEVLEAAEVLYGGD